MVRSPKSVIVAAALAATSLVLAAGCGGGGTPSSGPTGTGALGTAVPVTTAPAATTAAPTAGAPGPSPWPTDAAGLPVGWQLCQVPSRGIAISYPAGWFTTYTSVENQCTAFNPTAFTFPPTDSQTPLRVALYFTYVHQTAAQFIADYDPAYHSFTRREDVTINGLHAVRYEMTTLIAGPPEPAGSHQYGYLIENAGWIARVYTFSVPGDAQYAHNQYIVDQAATTVRFLH
jgi:hypothetical protein